MDFWIVVLFVIMIIIAPFARMISDWYWARKLDKHLKDLYDDTKSGS